MKKSAAKVQKMTYEKFFQAEQIIERPIAEVFDFFSKAENLQKITPPLLNFKILTPTPIAMGPGTLIEYQLKVRGLPMRWLTRIDSWQPPFSFSDVQLKGPYKLWHHTHEFEALSENRTFMRDKIRYEVPLGPLGLIANLLIVRKDIENIFLFRKSEIDRIFKQQ